MNDKSKNKLKVIQIGKDEDEMIIPITNSNNGPPLPMTPPKPINTSEAILLEIEEDK